MAENYYANDNRNPSPSTDGKHQAAAATVVAASVREKLLNE